MVQKLHICKKEYFDQLLDFQILFLLFLHTLLYYCTLWMLDFFNTIRMSNSLDQDQARKYVGPDLGPNCLQMLSAVNRQQKSLKRTILLSGQNLGKLAPTFSIWLKCWLQIRARVSPGNGICIWLSWLSLLIMRMCNPF